MIFRLNENEQIELKYSFRINVFFEQIQGKSVDFNVLSSNDLVTLFYCAVIASLQKEKKPVITMLEFLDAVDDYNAGEKAFIEFSNWYVEVIKAQYEVINSMDDEKKEEPEDTSKKKKH